MCLFEVPPYMFLGIKWKINALKEIRARHGGT
jgi:hypothetical protein